jgi:hypothetical protein
MSSEESEGQLSGGTQLSESREISLGEQQSVEQESYGLEEELARMEEESGAPDEDTSRGQEASSSGQLLVRTRGATLAGPGKAPTSIKPRLIGYIGPGGYRSR